MRQLITAVKRALCCGDPPASPNTAAAPIPTLSHKPDTSATQIPAEGFQITNEGPQSLWRRNTEQALKDLRASKELMIALKHHLREAMATLDTNLKIPSKNIADLDLSSTDLDVFVFAAESSSQCIACHSACAMGTVIAAPCAKHNSRLQIDASVFAIVTTLPKSGQNRIQY